MDILPDWFCSVICAIFCLVHLIVNIISNHRQNKKLQVICKQCGTVNECDSSNLLDDTQLQLLSDFVQTFQNSKKGE